MKIRERGQFLNQNFRIREISTRKINFFTRFIQRQLPIHNGTKNRLKTPAASRIIRSTNEITRKI